MSSIQLDTTVADLYRAHGIVGPFIATTHCVFAHLDLHFEIPREAVYPEDEDSRSYGLTEQDAARVRKFTFALRPVRRAFGLGNMEVIFFDPGAEPSYFSQVFGQLPPSQRPQPRVIQLDGELQKHLREATGGRRLLYWKPQGWMKEGQQDCLIDTDLSYELNSKRYLLTSGIRTPPSKIVSIANETDLSTSVLGLKPLPFVVKLLLSCAGYGTHIVTSEARRAEMLAAILMHKFRGGTEILISDYVNMVQDLSVHFVVGAPTDHHNRDNPLFVGTTVQNITSDGIWSGGMIDYAAQSDLESLLRDTVRDTTRRLPEAFVGWGGVDIVIDKDGRQWVVDLNPRFTGSIPLCLMSRHFYQQRRHRYAELGSVEYGGAVDGLHDLLMPFSGDGRVVILAMTGVDGQSNQADLVWGGRDKKDVLLMGEIIKDRLHKSVMAVV